MAPAIPEEIMRDVQNSPDFRGIPLQQVGVRAVRYPIKVSDKVNQTQHTIGSFNMYVDLTADFKGTHMSRFIEILNHYRHEIDVENLDQILENMRKRLKAEVSIPLSVRGNPKNRIYKIKRKA